MKCNYCKTEYYNKDKCPNCGAIKSSIDNWEKPPPLPEPPPLEYEGSKIKGEIVVLCSVFFIIFVLMVAISVYGFWAGETIEITNQDYYVFNTPELQQYDKILYLGRENNMAWNHSRCSGRDGYNYRAIKKNELYESIICCNDELKACYK